MRLPLSSRKPVVPARIYKKLERQASSIPFIAVLALAANCVLAQDNKLLDDLPTAIDLEAAAKQTPINRPPAGRQVAVLNIRLEYRDGVVEGAEVVSSKRIASFAPKVFARRGGNWEVFIGQDRRHSFLVSDPGYREAELKAAVGGEAPYEYVSEEGIVDWRLVVPLYVDGESLDADIITVIDRQTKKVIVEARI